MSVRKRWNSGIAFAVSAAIITCGLGFNLANVEKLALLVVYGLMSLSAVAFASALVQQEQEQR